MQIEIIEKSFGNKDKASMLDLGYFLKNWVFSPSTWVDQGRFSGYVYFLYDFENKTFKVGMTLKSLEKRFASSEYKNSKYTPLFAVKYTHRDEIFLKKTLIKEENNLIYSLSKFLVNLPRTREHFKVKGNKDFLKLKQTLTNIAVDSSCNENGMILNKKQFSILNSNEYELSERIYEQQMNTAKEIFDDFNKNHQPIHLVSPMQGGKTGVISCLAALSHGAGFKKYPNKIASVFILNGMNECSWTQQTKERMPVYVNNGNRPFVEASHLLGIPNLNNLLNNIKAPCLLVLDESQHGTNRDGLIDGFLNDLNIKLSSSKLPENSTSTDVVKNLQARGVYILFVSATDYYTQSKCAEYSNNFFKEIKMTPPKGYMGVKELYDEGAIHQSFELLSGRDLSIECKREIGELLNKNKYCIFRTKPKEFQKFKHSLEKEYGNKIEIIEYHSESTDTFDSVFMNNKPDKTTIILVKDYWRASKTLPKKHLGLFYDRTTENTSTSLQSAVGRCCGYYNYFENKFKVFTNTVIVMEHLGLIDYVKPRVLDSKMKTTAVKIGSSVFELYLKEIKKEADYKLLSSTVRYSKKKTELVRTVVPNMKNTFFRNKNGVYFKNVKNEQLNSLLKNKILSKFEFEKAVLEMNKEDLIINGCFGKNQKNTLVYETFKFKDSKYCLSYIMRKEEKKSIKMIKRHGVHD